MSKKARDTVAWVLVCIMAMLVPGVMGAAAGSTSTVYQKSYSIENLLSDYQYFTQSNLTAMSHTVGAIACGGNAEIENFGDGATAVSYFNHIVSIGNYNAGNYFENLPEYKGYIGLPAYYKTAGDGVSAGSNIKQYTGSGEYIDFSKAFENIASESEGLMEDAYTVTDGDIAGDIYNGFTLTLPFEKSKNIIIPKEIYDKVNYIKLGITDISDISKNRYTVSFTGFSNTDISLTFQYIGFSNSQSSNTKGILSPDGQSFNNDNSLKNKLTDGSIQAGQMNMSGMKLIWNFPDAKSITSEYTGGHIVAPKAEVTVKDGSGNFEGGIIAKSITNNSAEGHFYPYSAVKSSGSSSSEQPSSSPSTVGGSSSSEQPSSSPSTGGSSSSSEQPSSSPSTGGSSSSSEQPSSSPSTGGSSSSSEQPSSSPSTGGSSSSSEQSSSSPSTGGSSSSSEQPSSSPSTGGSSSSSKQSSSSPSTGGGSSSSKQSSSSPSTGGGSSSSKQSPSSPSTDSGSSSSAQSPSSPSTDSSSSSNNQPSGTVSTGGGSPSGNFSLNKTATATAVKNQYAKLPKTGSPIDASVLLAAAALSILTGSVVTWKKRR